MSIRWFNRVNIIAIFKIDLYTHLYIIQFVFILNEKKHINWIGVWYRKDTHWKHMIYVIKMKCNIYIYTMVSRFDYCLICLP